MSPVGIRLAFEKLISLFFTQTISNKQCAVDCNKLVYGLSILLERPGHNVMVPNSRFCFQLSEFPGRQVKVRWKKPCLSGWYIRAWLICGFSQRVYAVHCVQEYNKTCPWRAAHVARGLGLPCPPSRKFCSYFGIVEHRRSVHMYQFQLTLSKGSSVFAWQQYCLGHILLLPYITLLWDVVHKIQSFGLWARSAAGAFWSRLIIFDWYHLEIWHSRLTAAVKDEAFPCHGTLWQRCAHRKETWIWNLFNSQHVSQW